MSRTWNPPVSLNFQLVGTVRASRGQEFRYPLTFRIVT